MYASQVLFEVWEVGSEVTIDYGEPLRIVSAWFGKQPAYTPTSSTFELLALSPPPLKVHRSSSSTQ